ncbi:hypothetical protein E3N88_12810 [Mikania micrantha]|uniref:Retrotransposon gag domain-containing protein n=1 Tax=Mikania micrantha TaxID=192012 RepID=A0A5N6P6M8_9ASTR|nr:hypothetical protein E3N88_12810 [Mikania micrantha]
MSNSGNQPLSFTFVPPPQQTTVATVVHTAAMAKSAAMRGDGEEASVSSSDHAIPRSHPTAVTTSPMNIPSTGGGMIRAPFASHGTSVSLPPPFYPYTPLTPLLPPFNNFSPQTPVYTNPLVPPVHSNTMVSFPPYGVMNSMSVLSPEVTMPLAAGGTHLNTPVTQGVEQWTMPAWCHMFVQTFVGAALIWFDNLPAGSIASFEDLAVKFKLHFSQQRRHTRDKTEVLNLRRGPNETVEEFIVRYNLESLQINGTTEALKVAGFIHGVRDKHLIRKLHGVNGTPEDMNALMTIAKAYVQQEKSVTASVDWENRKSEKKTTSTLAQPSRKKEEKQETYPALTKTPGEIWRTEGLKWEHPRPLRDNPARDKAKYCDYHRVHGHNTDDCWHLKKQIEKFVSNGGLKHLQEPKMGEKRQKQKRKWKAKRSMKYLLPKPRGKNLKMPPKDAHMS